MSLIEHASELPVGHQAASAARRVLVSTLGPHVDSRTLADAQVVATELIGLLLGAPVQGEDPLGIEVRMDGRRVRVRVGWGVDGAVTETAQPAVREPHNLSLILIDHLADRWQLAEGSGAWFELAVEPSRAMGYRRA